MRILQVSGGLWGERTIYEDFKVVIICGAFVCWYQAEPHIEHGDPTWTIGLGAYPDPDDKSKKYGRVCIVQCKWHPDLSEVGGTIPDNEME